MLRHLVGYRTNASINVLHIVFYYFIIIVIKPKIRVLKNPYMKRNIGCSIDC